MARPKTLKYGSGELILKDLTQDEKDTIEKLLKGPEMQVVETAEGFGLEPIKVTPMLNNKAFSLALIGNKWCCVTIDFNPETLETGNMVIKPLHTNRNIAFNTFIIKMEKEMK